MNFALYLWIGLGSAIGGMARYGISGLSIQCFGETFPWGTLIVNITGSFFIGLFGTITGPDGRFLMNPTFRQFFMAGICGGYTTFSSFSLQTLDLIQKGDWLRAGVNVIGSVMLCLLAVWLGHICALSLNPLKN